MYDFVNIVGQITQYMDKPAVANLDLDKKVSGSSLGHTNNDVCPFESYLILFKICNSESIISNDYKIYKTIFQ